MDVFAAPSSPPSHYSKEVIDFFIPAGVFALLTCIAWAYVHLDGGPKEMLRAYCEQRKAKLEIHGIEMARAENVAKLVAVHKYQRRREQDEAQQKAQETINTVTMATGLVGSVVTPPHCVYTRDDRDETLHAQRMKQLHLEDGRVVRKSSMDSSVEPMIDPMSFTAGRGKDLAALYR
ncbi:hypothetical protein E8E11_003439 [Didymella keratinophila]|nr:hypothetical protein E8E11_003439 [Didymella keratinophila]